MQAIADAVVFLTGLPLAVLLIIDGVLRGAASEIAAGVVIAGLVALPSIILSARRRVQRQ